MGPAVIADLAAPSSTAIPMIPPVATTRIEPRSTFERLR
jgi:hypothetical protein